VSDVTIQVERERFWQIVKLALDIIEHPLKHGFGTDPVGMAAALIDAKQRLLSGMGVDVQLHAPKDTVIFRGYPLTEDLKAPTGQAFGLYKCSPAEAPETQPLAITVNEEWARNICHALNWTDKIILAMMITSTQPTRAILKTLLDASKAETLEAMQSWYHED